MRNINLDSAFPVLSTEARQGVILTPYLYFTIKNILKRTSCNGKLTTAVNAQRHMKSAICKKPPKMATALTTRNCSKPRQNNKIRNYKMHGKHAPLEGNA